VNSGTFHAENPSAECITNYLDVEQKDRRLPQDWLKTDKSTEKKGSKSPILG
jgi:hypothetical protein